MSNMLQILLAFQVMYGFSSNRGDNKINEQIIETMWGTWQLILLYLDSM
jgi:hypothetical protein